MTTSKYAQISQLAVSFAAPQVLLVEFNKPHKINAVDAKTWRDYARIFAIASTDPDVNAIVVAGQGERGFCAGLDLKDTEGFNEISGQATEPSRKAIKSRAHIREFQEAIKSAYDCPKPVIGVAHGISIGLAMDILTNVDIRLAAADTKFSVREIAIGMAADIGTLQQLPRLVGSHSWVREIVFTGRFFGADEALKQGLVSYVYPTAAAAKEAAIKLATQLAQYSPVGLQGAKESLNYAAEHTLEDGLKQIAAYNSFALQTDFYEGISATLEKRKARYEKL
ncbi:uncharacterized protein SAPINGB_P000439 [Magnusiomyces paraingens]|uniref:Enoyl-CoA hydratase n=1 Tax=Magnusiomyces paraingens TaxID=2606893 RepID=A0A5E8B5F2_9ASCO|nr:uncharacterized protein SAPINGB_P000439 [Saprochaete ingens]VVT44506.1 unnamed protein product [Saprochaete ingens]